jgi:S-adenosylmethionine decarboxylase
MYALENLGKHCTLEVYGVKDDLLNDLDFIDTILRQAAIVSGATILDSVFHQFQPQGITFILLLAESHISIHTWPEKGCAAIDIYTCGLSNPESAMWHVIEQFKPKSHSTKSFPRGGYEF